MKKAALAVCCMFVLSSLTFAMPGPKPEMCGFEDNETKEERQARKEKMEAMKKEHAEFKKEMDELLTKYNKADDKKKAEIKKEIRDLVAVRTDKDIADKKDMIEDQKTRIKKLEDGIASIEADKDKHIDNKVEFLTSPEGQAKMKEMREKKETAQKNKAYKDREIKGDKQQKKYKSQ